MVWVAAALIVASLAVSALLLKEDRKSIWEPQLTAHQKLKDIEQALVKYQREKHRLPCPAPYNQLPDSINFGVEATDCDLSSAISGMTRVNTGSGVYMRVGVLPVRTLGLNHKYHGDDWGNRLTYAVLESLTDEYKFTDTSGSLQLTNEAGTTVMTNGAVAVVVHGQDGKGAYTIKGGAMGKTCTSTAGLDQENCDNDAIFTKRDFNLQEGANYYDDNVIMLPVDAQAQGINIPCSPPRTPTPVTWSDTSSDPDPDAECSGPFVNMLHGSTQTIGNTNTNNSGTISVRCNNGVLETTASSCTYTLQCAVATQNWGGSLGCSTTNSALNNRAVVTLNNSVTGRTGQVKLSCRKGVITQSDASCSGNSCPLPWGGSVAHGGSTSAFSSASVPCGSTCSSQVRYCNFGSLSGTYTHQSCAAQVCANCSTPWGTTVAHNSSTTAYNAWSVGCGSACASETRTCWNGSLTGSYGAGSCYTQACAACNLPWGGQVGHGGSVYAYNTYDAGCGGTCYGETRYCNNGWLSGSYGAHSCGASCSACNLPWGGQVGHGGAVTAYNDYNPGCGDTCRAETRYCSNGWLSGSYGANSCNHPAGACMMPAWGCAVMGSNMVPLFDGVGDLGRCYDACVAQRNNGGIAGCCLYYSAIGGCGYYLLSAQGNPNFFYYSRTFW